MIGVIKSVAKRYFADGESKIDVQPHTNGKSYILTVRRGRVCRVALIDCDLKEFAAAQATLQSCKDIAQRFTAHGES